MESQPPTVTDAHSGATIPPEPTGTSNASTAYDLDRAARAGGFDDDMETGREIAHRLHAIFQRRLDTESLDHNVVRTEWIHAIADLWEGDPCGNTMWLATISNTYAALVRDLGQQAREARGRAR